MKKQILINFESPSAIKKSEKEAAKYFARAGIRVVKSEVDQRVKRTSGVSYREMTLTMSDSQVVKLNVTLAGDIYQVRVNGRVRPILDQSDHIKAVAEIAKMLEAGRTAFQRRLARAKVKLPPSVRTAAPRLEVALEEKRDALKDALQATLEEIARVNAL